MWCVAPLVINEGNSLGQGYNRPTGCSAEMAPHATFKDRLRLPPRDPEIHSITEWKERATRIVGPELFWGIRITGVTISEGSLHLVLCESKMEHIIMIYCYGAIALSGPGHRHCPDFTITLRHATLGRTPLDE